MIARAVIHELLHLAGGLVLTAAIFSAAAWAYPQARDTFRGVALATMAAVGAMSVPEIRRARTIGAVRKETELG